MIRHYCIRYRKRKQYFFIDEENDIFYRIGKVVLILFTSTAFIIANETFNEAKKCTTANEISLSNIT